MVDLTSLISNKPGMKTPNCKQNIITVKEI